MSLCIGDFGLTLALSTSRSWRLQRRISVDQI